MSSAMYPPRRKNAPWAMFTTRIRPKISVNPLATTKYSAAAVIPLSSVIRKSFGSLTAGPKLVPEAMNSTQMTGNATTIASRPRPMRRAVREEASSVMGRPDRSRASYPLQLLSRIGCCSPTHCLGGLDRQRRRDHRVGVARREVQVADRDGGPAEVAERSGVRREGQADVELVHARVGQVREPQGRRCDQVHLRRGRGLGAPRAQRVARLSHG